MTIPTEFPVSTNLDMLVKIYQTAAITVPQLNNYFASVQEWCTANLDVGGWYFSDFVQVTDINNDEIIIAKTVTFNNESDATAFKLKFSIV